MRNEIEGVERVHVFIVRVHTAKLRVHPFMYYSLQYF
ncbi:hypothetical protein J2X77_002035 [Sphingobacterium sp. 2149]|nr:hypothetical protein [Sphingobacterium sp. 2149]